jgi:hypothetical protein
MQRRHFSEPYIAVTMAAAVTRTIKLATGITLVTERNPLILANWGRRGTRRRTDRMGVDGCHRCRRACCPQHAVQRRCMGTLAGRAVTLSLVVQDAAPRRHRALAGFPSSRLTRDNGASHR